MQFKLGKISITLLNKVRNEPLFAFKFPFHMPAQWILFSAGSLQCSYL